MISIFRCVRVANFTPTLIRQTRVPPHITKATFSTMSSTVDQVKSTFSQNLGGAAESLTPAGQNFSIDDIPDLGGKVAIVTGGSEGQKFCNGVQYSCLQI